MPDDSESSRKAQSRGYHSGDVSTVISVDDVQRQAEAIAQKGLDAEHLTALTGGTAHNAIPRDAEAVIARVRGISLSFMAGSSAGLAARILTQLPRICCNGAGTQRGDHMGKSVPKVQPSNPVPVL